MDGIGRLEIVASAEVARSITAVLTSTKRNSTPAKNTSYCARVVRSLNRNGFDRHSNRVSRDVASDSRRPSEVAKRATNGARVAASPSTKRMTTFASR